MISRSSEYAIRALTYMAAQPRERFHLALYVAQELGLPPAFLGKVFQPLVKTKLLDSHRGRGGGFRLARPPEEVRLIEIVSAQQEDLVSSQRCPLAQVGDEGHACFLHEEWRTRVDSFVEILERTTLEDLLRFERTRSNSSYPLQRLRAPLTPVLPEPTQNARHTA